MSLSTQYQWVSKTRAEIESFWMVMGQWLRETLRGAHAFSGSAQLLVKYPLNTYACVSRSMGFVSKTVPLFLVGAALLLFGSSAQAFVDKNVSCNRTSSSVTKMGTFSPGEQVLLSMSLNCKMLRRFPQGGGISYTAFYADNNAEPGLVFYQPGRNLPVPYGGMGTFSSTCALDQCVNLPVGQQFDIVVRAVGALRREPGSYSILISLFLTSLANTNYSDAVMGFLYTYDIKAPTCNLISPKAVNLNFGTLSSDQLSSASQVADVSLSCESATKAEVTLVPTLNAVPGQTGVSTTTLNGLEMVSTWDDSKSPITFGAPRALTLGAGSNSLKLRFQPRLSNPSTAPSGKFASQYTLNVTYL